MLWRSRDEAKRLARNAATAQAQHKQTGGGENSGELLSECRRCKASSTRVPPKGDRLPRDDELPRGTPERIGPNLSGKRTER